ncbi:hypothetical protein [Empedobacter falsenii]
MKLFSIVIIALFIQTNLLFAQKIGFIESYNPILKHAHLKNYTATKFDVKHTENLEYNISPFIDSLFQENNINVIKYNDFNFSVFEKISPNYSTASTNFPNKKIISALNQFCINKKIDYLIIIDRHDIYTAFDPFKNTFDDTYDFGITTHDGTKKRIYFYNKLRMMYYNFKTGKLEMAFSGFKNDGLVNSEWKSVKFDTNTFDPTTKNLTQPKESQYLFLEEYKNRFKIEFERMAEKLNKDINSTK